MGRPRLSGHELPQRVYPYHGGFRYHPRGDKPVWLRNADGSTCTTLSQAVSAWAKLVDRPTSLTSMNALFDRYLIEVTPGKADATRRDDHRAMPYLRAFFGEMDPREVDAGHAYDYLSERGRQAPVRANREFAVVRHVMTNAVRWKVVKANPFWRIEQNPETPRDREVLPHEVLAWYRSCRPLLAAYTALKLLTGLRKGDLLRLRKEDWSDDGLRTRARKNERRFLFTRTPALRRAVCRFLEGPLARGRPVRSPEGKALGTPLVATEAGGFYTESGFDSLWQDDMVRFAAADNERFTEHDLRSKAGDDAEEAGRAGHRLLGNTEAQFQRAYQRRTQRIAPVR